MRNAPILTLLLFKLVVTIVVATSIYTQARAGNMPADLPHDDSGSANYMMPGCRAVIAGAKERFYLQGACTGTAYGLTVMGNTLGVLCVPREVTRNQLVHVVVVYIDKRPARMHESFPTLAVEALMEVWPCPKK